MNFKFFIFTGPDYFQFYLKITSLLRPQLADHQCKPYWTRGSRSKPSGYHAIS